MIPAVHSPVPDNFSTSSVSQLIIYMYGKNVSVTQSSNVLDISSNYTLFYCHNNVDE